MTETCVSATDFRVHLKDLANQVAEGNGSVVMARHGYKMVVMVSWDEYRAFLEHKRRAKEPEKDIPAAAAASVVPERLEHPEAMDLEEVKRVYKATTGWQEERVVRWRGIAFVSLKLRTGEYPDEPPF
jgi:PHD/YefM family antitoxin component YafN of YafNO toxin-antitoxin module